MKEINWNNDWNFWEDKNSFSLVWTTPSSAQRVNLPHDAMIAQKRNPKSKNGGNTGFYDGGTFIYTKNLHVTAKQQEQTIMLKFEGVYKNAQVYVNGQLAGANLYGYSTFYVLLNDYLNFGADNEIRVQVKTGDEPNSRWYSGTGIYRDVYLLVGSKAYLRPDGVMLKTLACDKKIATLEANIELMNSGNKIDLKLQTIIYNSQGKIVAQEDSPLSLFANENRVITQRLYINKPNLWDDLNPNLYQVELRLVHEKQILDQFFTKVGIRKLSLDPQNGLSVNGRSVKLRGAAIHHDSGLLGAVTTETNSFRQVYLLKKAGFNALRMAHQPAAPALLRACDQLGMYVLDETFDMWNRSKSDYDYSLNFAQNWAADVEAMVRKDYNHPSVILYSIGNEIPEIATNQGLKICNQIYTLIKRLDNTRYILAAVNGMYTIGNKLIKIITEVTKQNENIDVGEKNVNELMTYMDKYLDQIVTNSAISQELAKIATELDIVGYNYMSARYSQDVKEYPNRIMVGSETYPPEIARNWAAVKKFSQVIGDFTWTGWDYLGEAGVGVASYQFGDGGFGAQYPALTSYVGDSDLTGFRRPISYYREIVFGIRQKPYIAVQNPHHFGEKVQLTPWILSDTVSSWSWNINENSEIVVEVYSSGTEVELILNGKSYGKKPAGSQVDYRTLFNVNYVPGELIAKSYDHGQVIGQTRLLSAGKAVKLDLNPETKFNQLDFNENHHFKYIDVCLCDQTGKVVTDNDTEFSVTIEGKDAYIAAVGSGNPKATLPFKGNIGQTFNGRALIIIDSQQPAKVTVTSKTGLTASIKID